jgi:hypothetical protein
MPSILRLLSRSAAPLCVAASLLLNGCSDSSSPAPTPPKPALDTYTIGVMLENQSPKCAWITPYWSNKLAPWHQFKGDSVRPRFVEAGKKYNFAYLVIPKNPIAPRVEMKVRAEIVPGPGCNGAKIADVDGVNKYLEPREGILEACSRLKVNPNGSFSVTDPQPNKDCSKP